MKNMKIEINAEQPIEAIELELKEKGFKLCGRILDYDGYIITINKSYTWCSISLVDVLYSKNKLTTLAELKEMK